MGRVPRVVVIGVGNRYRGDDGVGHRVIDRLGDEVEEAQSQAGHPSRPPTGRLQGTELHYSDGEPSRLVEQWDGADLAVVVDAVATGADPGRVVVFDAAIDDLPARAATSSHAGGVGEAWALGSALGTLPGRLLVVGVEAGSIHDGEGLTEAVYAALPIAHRLVRAAIATAPTLAPHPTSAP
ncbi:MAG: hydrogenase maturation protease [Actinobacteria bacterium]|nr:hydrogenase maturation protease [Actinomycetota bacterium]